MTTEVFKKGLRGTIVDLVQHHDWILIAASHSEGLNLGIQALSFSYGSHGSLQIIECPSIIQSLVSLSTPNIKEKTKGIAVDGEELDPKMLSLAMHNRGLFTDAERTIHSLFYALIDEEGDMGAEISPREEKTLAYIRKEVLRGEEAWQTIETEIQTYRKNEAFRFHKMAGQQVFALGTDGL
ncbi:MAG: hypothetical protein VX278_05775, partial [Myxococcota bacterium]|nr:hypothetical protein [Myxococcota bacterium]